MLTRPQQILLKRAQAEAGIEDAEYRATLMTLTACRTSTDPRLTDRQLDDLLSYFEAIYWRRFDAGEIQASGSALPVFRQRNYWAHRNGRAHNSRDRFVEIELQRAIEALHTRLAELGFGFAYTQAIEQRIHPFSLVAYKAALERTLKSKLGKPVSS